MGIASLLLKDPAMFVVLVLPLLFSVIVHELSHGYVAYLFGDDTAKRAGRLSLNPLVHLDLMGTIALFFVGFGWARPVPVDYRKLRHSRTAIIMVSVAGCTANILIATLAIAAIKTSFFGDNKNILTILFVVARINIILGAFNLIPIPPLDGSRILRAVLPEPAQKIIAKLEPYGLLVLIGLLYSGFLDPVITAVQMGILGIIGVILGG